MAENDRSDDWTGASVAGFGYLGLIPFWAPVAATLYHPAWGARADFIQGVYGALILSFLGGARFGHALDHAGGGRVISLSMIPSVYSLAVLVLPTSLGPAKLLLLAAGLAVAWWWDRRAPDLIAYYRVVRGRLTLLAALALVVQASLVWTRV